MTFDNGEMIAAVLAAGLYSWMNRTLYLGIAERGVGERRPTGVRIDIYRTR